MIALNEWELIETTAGNFGDAKSRGIVVAYHGGRMVVATGFYEQGVLKHVGGREPVPGFEDMLNLSQTIEEIEEGIGQE